MKTQTQTQRKCIEHKLRGEKYNKFTKKKGGGEKVCLCEMREKEREAERGIGKEREQDMLERKDDQIKKMQSVKIIDKPLSIHP